MDKGGNTSATIARPGDTSLDLDAKALGDFDLLAEGIFNVLWKDLGFVYPCIAMFDTDKRALRIMKHASHPSVESILKSMMGKTVAEFIFSLNHEENLLVRSYQTQKIFIRDTIAELATPYVKQGMVIKAIDKIIALKMIAVVPITADGKSIGVLCFGSRKQSELSKTEKFFLQRLSETIAVYLQQSWFIKLLQIETSILKKQNQNLSEILRIKRSFLVSLSELVSKIPEADKLQSKTGQRIQDHMHYLESLMLLSESYAKNGQETDTTE